MKKILGSSSILYFVNVDWFFISHRLPIALEAQKQGYKIKIACHFTSHKEDMINLGFEVSEIPFSRSGGGLINELKTLIYIRRVIKQYDPSIIHAVTIKPVLYTGLALKTITKKLPLVAAISGLGYVFTANSLRAKLTKFIVSVFYKVALSQKYKTVIFQNNSDEQILTEVANLKQVNKCLIKGSGADLSIYNYLPEQITDKVTVVMACRLLREKGVYEYIAAARLVKKLHSEVEFLLVGTPDLENPNTVKQSEIDTWVKEKVVSYLGHRDDIPAIFADSNIVCLPSFYGEGVPKVLIEAAACGRAIVTTDNPGCRDAIIDGETGISVPLRDYKALANAMIKLIVNSDLRISMGQKARGYAEKEFDVKSVVGEHINIYSRLLAEVS
jgi:glycosyltransferase involved in cell wall biosynthesis